MGHCLLQFPLSETMKYSSIDSTPFKITQKPTHKTKLKTLPGPQTELFFQLQALLFTAYRDHFLHLCHPWCLNLTCASCVRTSRPGVLWFSLTNSAWWQLIPVKVKSCAWRVLSDQSLFKHIEKSQHIMSEDVHFPGRVDELALRNVCF